MFIVLEGIDGAGTTTQVTRLTAALRDRGLRALETREPSDGPIGRVLRRLLGGGEHTEPAALALLFAADRLDHLAREVEPALRRGEMVLSDRYLGSSLIYQGEFCERDWLRAINRGARPADLTLLLDVPPEEAHRRRLARGAAPELFEDPELQARLQVSYLQLPGLLPDHGVVRIDGVGLAEEVTERLLAVVLPKL